MNSLFSRDLCAALVLSFGHFLWIGTLIAVVAAIAVRRQRTAKARYRVWLAALVAMAVSPFVTLVALHSLPTAAPVVAETRQPAPPMPPPALQHGMDASPIASEPPANAPSMSDESGQAGGLKHEATLPVDAVQATHNSSAQSLPPVAETPRESAWWRDYAPLLTSLYLTGVALMGLRLSLGLWGGRRLRNRAAIITERPLLDALQRQADALGMKLVPALAYCERVAVPTVLGILKPMILLPLTLTSGLSPEQMESVLAHELAHLRRSDHLVNLMQCVIESVLFFHPAVWWVSRRIRDEREHCCDDLVVACGAVPLDYAASLLRVAELSREAEQQRGHTQRWSFTAVSLFATGDRPSTLRQRIARLLGESSSPALRLSPRVVLVAICLPLIGFFATIQIGASNQQPSASDDNKSAGIESPSDIATPRADDAKADSKDMTAASTKAESYVAELPNGLKVEFVGITKNTTPAKDGWKPDGLPLGDVGYWPATITLHSKNTSEAYVENGPHPEPDAEAIDLLVRFHGLKAQPSLSYDLATNGVSHHHWPLKEPYELRLSTRRRGEPSPGAKWSIPDGEMRIGLTDEPWGKWLQISPEGKVLNPLTDDDLYRSSYEQVRIERVEPHDRAPNKLAVVLNQPKKASSLYAFEIRGIDQDGKHQWVTMWERHSTEDANINPERWGLASSETKPLARYEFRLRPYRHFVTFTGVSLEPGKESDVKVSVVTLPNEPLEFLKPYPKLHGLSLDMTEPQFWEIVKQQELKTRKTVEGEKVTHHIALGDGHTLIVMFDKDAKCSGIQRVRGEGEKADERDSAKSLPQSKESQALFQKWQRLGRGNGNIPGGTLGPLVRVMRNFVKNNPTHEGSPKFAELLKRIDVTRDWSRDEAVKLLDEVSAIYPSLPEWVEAEKRFVLGGDVVVGKPLPEELKDAPWGEAQPNGLRVAWLLEPRGAEHRLNTPLKSRVVFHNSGKNAVVFRALTWNQSGGHKARDAQGNEININSTDWTTIPMTFACRLAPGEFFEVVGAGIGVGANKDDEDWRDARSDFRVGAWIEAKAGDEVTFSPDAVDCDGRDGPQPEDVGAPAAPQSWWLKFIKDRLSLDAPLPAETGERGRLLDRAVRDLFGNGPTAEELTAFKNDATPEAFDALAMRLAERSGFESFSGSLTSGPTKFRVLPVDPDAAKKPRTAKNPGQYNLGGNTTFVVTRRPIGERIVNEAHLSSGTTDANKPAPRKPHPVPLPDDYDSWIAAWMRGGTVLWVAQKGADQKESIRRYDFTNPASVRETVITELKPDETLPQAILDVLSPRSQGPLGNEKGGLDFLKPYPKLHGLSLDMTEPQFWEIVKQQELKTRKTVEGGKVTHQITLGDGHTLIVMFDKDAKCSGIQRVRGEDEKQDAKPASAVSTKAIYHAEPEHLWNRMHEALFVRRGPDAREYGRDRLEPVLWSESKHLLEPQSHQKAMGVLTEFLANGERLINEPLKRAMMQRDLWLVFNWAEGAPHGRFAGEPKLDEADAKEAVKRLRTALASAIRRLELEPLAIQNLPDNYAAAVASGQFAKSFDGQQRERPYLPPDLFDPNGPWACIGRVDDRTAPQHLRGENPFTNSVFAVFVRLPNGRAGVADYLKQLPAFPQGTQLALVRRAMVIDSGHRVVASNLIESVQLRVIGATRGDETFFEFRLSRPNLFAAKAGGLIASTKTDSDLKTGFLVHPFDPMESADEAAGRPFPGAHAQPLLRCTNCHEPNRAEFQSARGLGRTPENFPLADMPLGDVTKRTIAWKATTPEWWALQRLLSDPDEYHAGTQAESRSQSEGVIEEVADKAIAFEDGRLITTDADTKYARLTDKGEVPAERKELKVGVRVRYELAPGQGATKIVSLPAKKDAP